MSDAIPLEQTDPWLAEQIRQIANKEHPVVRGFSQTFMGTTFRLNNGNLRSFPTSEGRNSPCPCGSGRKFKKCCIIWYP